MTPPAGPSRVPAKRAPRGRGRPADHQGEQTRAMVLVTAQRLFGESGYGGVSMEALAAACGINARAIYYHFASKRELYEVATTEAFTRFGAEVAERVFSQVTLRARVEGYLEVYRHLYAEDPTLLAFVGMVLVDALAGNAREMEGSPADAGALLNAFLEQLVDDAIARDELHPDLDREGALLLIRALGMGLSLASIGEPAGFPAMLDALGRLNDGTLYRSPTPEPSPRSTSKSTSTSTRKATR